MPRLILSLAAAGLLLAACSPEQDTAARAIGDPDNGKALILRLGCGACHEIPGVEQAHGLVGPPLSGIARRTIIAGMLPNTPQNMIRWLQVPQTVVPGNAMPNLELNDHDARDIAAYLATLR
ncbi:MAG TPA: c-type cytochrome [Phenylobacterium sp.]|jgi:cytochrome c2|nr:c-type cytochrome [Phenylobacterium sp.]